MCVHQPLAVQRSLRGSGSLTALYRVDVVSVPVSDSTLASALWRNAESACVRRARRRAQYTMRRITRERTQK